MNRIWETTGLNCAWFAVIATVLGGCMIEGEQLADLSPSDGSFSGITVSCSDGVKNGNESDVDCGGSVCKPCDGGKACASATDCGMGVCSSGVCCNESCDGACIACNLPNSVGICAYVPEGQPHDLYGCSSPMSSCDGKGSCKALAGQPCTKGMDCMSGMCVSGSCQ